MQYNRLYLITLDRAGHEKTCNYWYLVRSEGGALAHTAFTHRVNLLRWLEERNLSLTEELPAHGEHSGQALTGGYSKRFVTSEEEFNRLVGIRTVCLHNRDYTAGILTTGEDGARMEHVAHFSERPKFDYWAMREFFG